MRKYDWIKLRALWIAGDYKHVRDFAEREGIPYNSETRKQVARWKADKQTCTKRKADKIIAKTIEKSAEREANRNARILTLADRIADKLEQAVRQLESHMVTNKVKTKKVKYDLLSDKVGEEVTTEEEIKQIVPGLVDRQGVKLLASALKDLKDLQPKDEGGDTGDKEAADSYVEALKGQASKVWEYGS